MTLITALLLAAMSRSLDGTLVAIDASAQPRLTLNADRQFQTFAVVRGAVIERQAAFAGRPPATARIELSDLTPGEYVRLRIDRRGRVTQARAFARLERATVQSVVRNRIILTDGTALTAGSILRLVGEKGKPLPPSALRGGEGILLFHHPQTGNVYRLMALR